MGKKQQIEKMQRRGTEAATEKETEAG